MFLLATQPYWFYPIQVMTLVRVLVGRGGDKAPRPFRDQDPKSLNLDSLYLVFKDRFLCDLQADFARLKETMTLTQVAFIVKRRHCRAFPPAVSRKT